MEIKQAYFSKSVKFFEQGFLEYWNLEPYNNPYAPAIFVGVYRYEDVLSINKHKGYRVIANTGELRNIFFDINPICTFVTGLMGGCMDKYSDLLSRYYDFVKTSFPIKDFSPFKPSALGNKIYCYLGNESGKYVMGHDLIEEIRKNTQFDIIIGMQGNSMEFVKKNFYDQCFVNIKPTITGGLTGACELAYMGRYTISNTPAKFCIGYKTIDDIIEAIEQESRKIGTIQPSCINNFFTTGAEWKNIEFWLLEMAS